MDTPFRFARRGVFVMTCYDGMGLKDVLLRTFRCRNLVVLGHKMNSRSDI